MSKEQGIDDFDNIRILESAFNRLFLAIEHLANAVMLKEKGNYSKKHFGDFNKLKELKEKYNLDLAIIYQTTYNFRIYADYRKSIGIEDKFDNDHLVEQIKKVKNIFYSCLKIFEDEEDFRKIITLFKEKINSA